MWTNVSGQHTLKNYSCQIISGSILLGVCYCKNSALAEVVGQALSYCVGLRVFQLEFINILRLSYFSRDIIWCMFNFCNNELSLVLFSRVFLMVSWFIGPLPIVFLNIVNRKTTSSSEKIASFFLLSTDGETWSLFTAECCWVGGSNGDSVMSLMTAEGSLTPSRNTPLCCTEASAAVTSRWNRR